MEVDLASSWGPILIAVVSAAGTILVTLLKARGDKSMSIPEHYQGLMQEVKGWTTLQLEEQGRQIKDLQNDVSELRQEVRTWKSKFRDSMSYIRALLPLVRDRDDVPPMPDSLRDDL